MCVFGSRCAFLSVCTSRCLCAHTLLCTHACHFLFVAVMCFPSPLSAALGPTYHHRLRQKHHSLCFIATEGNEVNKGCKGRSHVSFLWSTIFHGLKEKAAPELLERPVTMAGEAGILSVTFFKQTFAIYLAAFSPLDGFFIFGSVPFPSARFSRPSGWHHGR